MGADNDNAVNIGRLVDEQRIGRFNILLVCVAALATIIDGYDIFVPGFIAPELVRQWHFPPSALGPMFAWGLGGIVIGSAFFGYVGDRMGRKRAIVLCSLLYGVLSLVSIGTQNLTQFTVLRFLIGLGIGGAIPNAIALVAELTPQRVRPSFVLLLMVGAPTGQLLPGLATLLWVPTYGWHILLVIGGIGPILIALLTQLVLPESIKYLTLQPHRRAELIRLAQRLRPELKIPEGARFFIAEAEVPTDLSPRGLFAQGLAPFTLLIWLCLGAGLLATYFIGNWLPAVLQQAGLPIQVAAGRLAFYAIGGILGGLVMTNLVRQFGVWAIVGVFVVAVPLVGSIGVSGLGVGGISALTAAAGFCVIAIINGVECVMGLVYPTAIRAKGAGWALGIGRLGALFGPLFGGTLIAMHLSNFEMFLAPAICLVAGLGGAIALAVLYRRRFGGAEAQIVGSGDNALLGKAALVQITPHM